MNVTDDNGKKFLGKQMYYNLTIFRFSSFSVWLILLIRYASKIWVCAYVEKVVFNQIIYAVYTTDQLVILHSETVYILLYIHICILLFNRLLSYAY